MIYTYTARVDGSEPIFGSVNVHPDDDPVLDAKEDVVRALKNRGREYTVDDVDISDLTSR